MGLTARAYSLRDRPRAFFRVHAGHRWRSTEQALLREESLFLQNADLVTLARNLGNPMSSLSRGWSRSCRKSTPNGGQVCTRQPRSRRSKKVALKEELSVASKPSGARCDVFRPSLRHRGGEGYPLLHEPAPLVEQVTTPIRLLHLITDNLRKHRLHNLILE